MPCSCDYMEVNEHEKQSKVTAECILYANAMLGNKNDDWICDAANSYCGAASRIKELVVMLCTICEGMTPEQEQEIIYDGRQSNSRKLAEWWDRHKKADQIRMSNEAAKEETKRLQKVALAKLTDEDRRILGL